ncbi:MAG: hypothetical protein R3C97_13695 [Geminicoccaceae bacterium]
MIEPPPAAAMAGRTACAAKKRWRRLTAIARSPESDIDGIDRMAFVARGVVDENARRSSSSPMAGRRPTKRVDIGPITRMEPRRPAEPVDKSERRLFLDVEKATFAP